MGGVWMGGGWMGGGWMGWWKNMLKRPPFFLGASSKAFCILIVLGLL